MTEETMVRDYQKSATQHFKEKEAIRLRPMAAPAADPKHQKLNLDALLETKVLQPVKKCCHYINETSKAIQARQGQLWVAALPLILLLLATLVLLLDW